MVRDRTPFFAQWSGTERFVLLKGPVQNALFCLMDRCRNVCVWFMARNCFPKGWNSRLPTWAPQVTIARNCRLPEFGTLGSQPGNHVTIPSNCWLARNCRFQKVGTPDSQPGNHRLPLQGTACSQRLELIVPKLGTIGYHCEELPVPKRLELAVAIVGTTGYHCKELPVPRVWNSWFPTWEP